MMMTGIQQDYYIVVKQLCFGFKQLYFNFNTTISFLKICIAKGFITLLFYTFADDFNASFFNAQPLRVFMLAIYVLVVNFLRLL